MFSIGLFFLNVMSCHIQTKRDPSCTADNAYKLIMPVTGENQWTEAILWGLTDTQIQKVKTETTVATQCNEETAGVLC